jgi:hypothetical protein
MDAVHVRRDWPYDTHLKAASRLTNLLQGLSFQGIFSRYDLESGVLSSYQIGQITPIQLFNGIRDAEKQHQAPILAWNYEHELACIFSDSAHIFCHNTLANPSQSNESHRVISLDRCYTSAEWINSRYLLLSSKQGFAVLCTSSAQVYCSFQGATTSVHGHRVDDENDFQLFHAHNRILKCFSSKAVCLSQTICDAPIHFMANNQGLKLKSIGVENKMILPDQQELEPIDQGSALSSLLSIGIMQKQQQSSRPTVCGSVLNAANGLHLIPVEWSEMNGPSPTSVGPFASHHALDMVAFADLHSPTCYLWGPDSKSFELEVFRFGASSTRVIGLSFVSYNYLCPSQETSGSQFLYILLGNLQSDPLAILAPSSYEYHNVELVVVEIPQSEDKVPKVELEADFMEKMKADLFRLALHDIDHVPPTVNEEVVPNSASNDILAQIMQSIAAMNHKMDDMVSSQQRIETKLDRLCSRMDSLENRR